MRELPVVLAQFGSRGAAFVLLLALGAGLVSGCGGAQSRFANHMERGKDYFAHGDYTRANLEFRNAMQIAPKDPGARVMSGRTAERLGRVADAVAIFQGVVDTSPDNRDARVNLARIFVFAGLPDRAMEIVQPWLAKHPDDAMLLSYRAAARMALKDQAGALADVDRSIALDPANEDAIGLRARLYRQAGDLPGAIALVSDAVKRLPNSTELREVLGDLYLASAQPQKAEEELRALVALEPTVPRRRLQLAVFYAQTRRPDDAQRTLEENVKAFPKDNEVKLALVDFLAAQRSKEAGQKALEGFVARDPDNYPLRLQLAALLQRSGDEKGAVAAYQEVIRRDGTHTNGLAARNRLAAIAVRDKRFDDAKRLIAEVLDHNPRDNEALTERGEIALVQSDPASAIIDLRAVVRDQPQAFGLQRLLAQAYVANGQPELAEQALRTAMDLNPTESTIRIELARLLLGGGKVEAAIDLLEAAVKSTPSDPGARELLVRAYLARPDLPAAQTAAEDLKTLRPDSASGYYMAAMVAQAEKRLDDAEKNYQQALGIQPDALDVLSAYAHLKLAREGAADAVALVKSASEKNAPNSFILNLLGELYLVERDIPRATDVLTQATQLDPSWWVAYRTLGAAKYDAKDIEGSIAAYRTAIKIAPSEPEVVVELANIYQSQRRVDDAIACYDEWNRRNPRVASVANNLAMLLVTYRADRESLDRARALTTAFDASTEGNLLDTDGWVRFKRGEYKEAMGVLQRAAAQDPSSRETRYHLGMAELRAGQMDRARADLETALAGTPQFSGYEDARTALASLKSRTS